MPTSRSESSCTTIESKIDQDPVTPMVQAEEDADDACNARLLVLGENPASAEMLAAFLKESGYTEHVVLNDPARVLDMIDEMVPDAILVDLDRVETSSLDLLAAIRSREGTDPIPVILLFGSVTEEARIRSIELGVESYLFKPANPRELLVRLRNALSLKSYRNQLEYFDAMTGLPNRAMFLQLLDQTLSKRTPMEKQATVIHVNLDRFKQVNEGLGYRVGDLLLQAVAERIKLLLRSSGAVAQPEPRRQLDFVSRLGSDEFGILSLDLQEPDDAGIIARRILAAMAEPFTVAGRTLFVTPSIGIAICPDDGDDSASLLKHAAIAMDLAKNNGGNGYEFFAKKLNQRSLERLSLANALRNAITRNELRLYYQPKLDLVSGRIVGVEALMRWLHPGRGLLGPNEFIPIAEESGAILELGRWALRTACRQTSVWRRFGRLDLQVAVNLSPVQFRQGGLVEAVAEALNESGLPPSALVLELTESSMMSNVDANIAVLTSLKDLGVELSIDDFGTGYSSLSYLQRFPIDELKIDRSFITGMSDSDTAAALVAGIIGLATALKLRTIAEGIENPLQLRQISEMGCQYGQGYLFSKPVSPARIPVLALSSGSQGSFSEGPVKRSGKSVAEAHNVLPGPVPMTLVHSNVGA